MGNLTSVTAPLSLREVVALLNDRYPPALASDWDAVGLACGDPDAPIRRVLFAVDPVLAVVDEALLLQVDLVVTHHPLWLRGVHSVAATTSKGKVAHTLISHGMALYSAHTNADHADPGVSDALAAAVGVSVSSPLIPDEYDPAVGTGRLGRLPEPMTLAQFADQVAAALPATSQGIRVAGDLGATISSVAVCGGSGDAFLAAAAQSADVYVTSDLRHHRAQDHLAEGGCALIDVAHWAAEWPWLSAAARGLEADVAGRGTTVDTYVSTIVTDPWTSHLGSTS